MFKNISTSAILSQKDDLVISSENTNFEIKTLNTKEDLEVLKQIYDDGSLNLNDENNYINKIWKQSEEQNRYFIVSLVDSKPVGFAASYYTDIRGGTYFLSELYVNKNFRKQGVAEFLVKKIIEFSTQKGYTITTTQTEHDNIPAQKLYAKIGFKPVNNENTQHLTLQIENDLIWAVDKFIKTITETVKSPAVFITCGKAFSGKTYLSKLLAKEIQAERFSYDEIWLEIRQTVDTENDPKLDFLNILEIIKERGLSSLAQGKTVIIDTLFDTKEWRSEIRNYFKDKNYPVWTIYTKISDQIQQDRITENKISKERHQVNEKLLEEFNQKFEEPNDEDNVFVFECENLKSRVGNRELNPNKTTFRQADLSDITGILAVQKKSMIDAFVGERYGITLEMVEQDFVGKETRLAKYFETGTYFVAENTEKIVGVIAASEDRMLRTMWVDPDFQRQGIGRKLMLMAVQKLGSFEDIKLETGLQKDGQAVKFYESLGFEKTGKESRIKFFSEQTGEVENIEFVLKKDKIEQILQKYQEKPLTDLVSLIEMKVKNKTDKPFIIAIDGRGGSGKSTLAEKIAQNFKTQIIKTDDFITFYKPEEITDKDYYWDKSRFIQDVLIPLKNKQDFQYDICRWKTGELVREEKIDLQNELIIIEGLHALHQDLLNFYDLKIWVNTPLEVSLERGKVRDLQKGKENIDELWNFFVPVQEKYISEHKPDQKADLVVSTENDGYEIVGKPKDEIEDKENTDFQIKILNTKEDLEVLKQIYNDESLNLQDENNYINKIWNKKEKQDSYFIICLIGSKPAGFAASLYYDDMVGGTYFLSELYVNKNFRKQGVGQFLVKKVIEFASRKRYKVTTTQTEQDNIPAQKLYNKIGFKPVKNEYTQHLTLQIKNDLVLSEGEKLESKIEKVENKYAPVGAVPKERGSYEMFPDLLNSIQEKAKNSNLDQKHQNNIDFLKKELVKVKNLELKNTSIEFFASGQCNDLYLITKNDKKYLARITNWEQNKVWKIKQEEYEKLNFIKDLKIAPTSHYYDLGQNEKQIHWCLVDFVEGKTVQQLSDKNITQLALTLKKLHENTIKNKYGDRWFELEDIPYKSYTLKEYSENKPKFVQKAGYDELKKSFEKINWAEIKKFCLIHNDLKPLNMVENNGEILLIDWEYSYMDIPENDIARFFVENSLTEIQKKLFLENYLPLENLDFTMEILQVFVDLYEFFEVREDVVEPVYNLAQSTKPFIIAIDGRGGSGKSTLAQKLLEKLSNSVLIERETFMEFMKGMDTASENWDAKNFELDKNAFEEEIRKNQDKSVIILEGLKTFEIDSSLKIWVEVDKKTGNQRAKKRDAGEKVNPIGFAKFWQEYENHTEKYITISAPQQKADLVISTEDPEYKIKKDWDISTLQIETERLILKPVSLDYAEDNFREFTLEITKLMNCKPDDKIEETLEFLERAMREGLAKTDLHLDILNKENQEFLGMIGLHDLETDTPEIGIWFKKSAHGNKFGQEAAMGLKKWANKHLNYKYLFYPVDQRNIGSRKVAESLSGILQNKPIENKINLSGNALEFVEYHIFNPNYQLKNQTSENLEAKNPSETTKKLQEILEKLD